MVFYGRVGLLLGVLAHAGAGSCAHVPSGGSPNFSGRGGGGGSGAKFEAPRSAPVEVRPAAPSSRPGAELAATLFDAALETAAAPPPGQPADLEGGGDEGPGPLQPPDILLCVTTAECGPGGACDRVTQSMQFARSGEAVGLCRPICHREADCLAHEHCLARIDPADATVGGCVPDP